jgi:hypothetical protein
VIGRTTSSVDDVIVVRGDKHETVLRVVQPPPLLRRPPRTGTAFRGQSPMGSLASELLALLLLLLYPQPPDL